MAEEQQISLTEDEAESAKLKLLDMQAMIGQMGWRWFIAEINREIEVIKDDLLTAPPERVPFLQGKYEQCQQIVFFEDLVVNYLKGIEDGDMVDTHADV